MGYAKQKRKAGMATKKVDKAQNALLKDMKKDIDELKSVIETKYNYQVESDNVDSYDGSTPAGRKAQITAVAIGETQGLSDQDRIGDQVTLKHIDMHYKINLATPRTTEFVDPSATVRVILFWDNQPTAVTTAGAMTVNPVYWPQMLQLCDSTLPTNDVKKLIMMSEKDWDQKKRFSFIYDKTHTLASGLNSIPSSISTGATGARGTTGCVTFRKNYKGQKIRYVAGGLLPQNRQLYFAFLSDVSGVLPAPPAPATQTPQRPIIDLQIRCLYEDA
jgi:hypothetical protein